jgi:hypothetical protein
MARGLRPVRAPWRIARLRRSSPAAMFVPRRLRQRTFADTTAPSVSRPAGPRRTSSCRSAITSPPMSSRARRATPPVQVGGAAAGRRDPRLGWRGNRVTAAAPNSIGTVLRDFLNWALFLSLATSMGPPEVGSCQWHGTTCLPVMGPPVRAMTAPFGRGIRGLARMSGRSRDGVPGGAHVRDP